MTRPAPKPRKKPARMFVMVEVDDEQKAILEAAAAEAGAPTSTWLRMLGLAAAKKARGRVD